MEWADASTVDSYRLLSHSVVQTVIWPSQQSPSSAAASGGDAAGAEPSLLSPEEVPRSIVVSGIPVADPVATERALLDAFSSFGGIARLIFQDEGLVVEGRPTRQRAVIVFQREPAATNAVIASGMSVLGAPVQVVLASHLPPSEHASSGGAGYASSGLPVAGSGAPLVSPDAVAAVAHLLAQGYMAGERGIASVRRYGEERGYTDRVRVVYHDAARTAADINQRYHIVPIAHATVAAALNAAKSIDQQYRISQRSSALVHDAMDKGREMLNEYPAAARVVHSASSLLGQTLAAVSTAVGMARQEVISGVRSASPSASSSQQPVNLPQAFPPAAAPSSSSDAPHI